MNYTGYVAITMILLFIAYDILVERKFGILSSISASSYKWIGMQRLWFVGWLMSLGVLGHFLDFGIWGFGLSVGFITAGLTYRHRADKQQFDDELHTGGTILSMTCGLIGLWVESGIVFPIIIFAIGAFILWRTKWYSWIWWTENLATATIGSGLIVRALT